MSTKKNGNFDKTKGILIVVIGVLVLTLLGLFITYSKPYSVTRNNVSTNSPKGSIVQLGKLEYDFSSGKPIKRTDANLISLKSFLITEGNKSVGPNCDPVYHIVMMSSSDEKQVLLSYGCPYPNARMFAVRQNEEWQLISPTNQFDMFGIPLCTHVDTNNIDRTIAPVCAKEDTTNDAQLVYRVR